MKNILLRILLMLSQDSGFDLPMEVVTLDNGMRVVVVPRHDVPRVYCSLWWRVGSVDERPGLTGLSHFFEHMMFMGTDRMGTTDPKKDAELNAKIEETMSKIREIKLHRLESRRRGTEPSPEKESSFKQLWSRYEQLVDEQKKITIPEHLAKTYQANGGTLLNATTSYDRTNYFVDLPANKIELFFWLEADRFAGPVFRSFYPEREVVKEERRMRYESTPTGLIKEAFWAAFWQAHPYSWPVIGWMSDIDQYTLADAERYYAVHYSPQNCTAIFVGDIEADHVISLARRYFGRLKRFTTESDPIVTQEPEPSAERRVTAQADAQAEITIRWHGPSGVHRDSVPCDLLMNVLSGRSGRLYRPLVEEKNLAVDVSAGYWSLRYGGVLDITAHPREGVTFEKVEAEILSLIEELRTHGATAREVEKVKNRVPADLIRDMKTYQGIANQLGYFETIGSTEDFHAYLIRLETATAEDIRRCAQSYLRPEARNVLIIRRKEKK